MLHGVGGAKHDGVFGLWFGKAPGVDRTADAFRHANFRGVGRNGGVLALAGDDPHAVSSMLPSDSNVAFYDFQMPFLFPGDVQEILDLGLHGYALSRAAGLWVGFKVVSSVADSGGTVCVDDDRIQPIVPVVQLDGRDFQPAIRLNEAGAPMRLVERELFYARLEIARRYGYENRLNRVVFDPPGATARHRRRGKNLVRPAPGARPISACTKPSSNGSASACSRSPCPTRSIRARCASSRAGLEEIIVVEEKRPFIELFVKDALYGQADCPRVVGKSDETGAPLLRAHDELDPDTIARALAARLPPRRTASRRRIARIDRAQRPAAAALHRAQPRISARAARITARWCAKDGAVVGAGIGCHVMALYMGKENFGRVIGYTQMGAEGAQWAGLAPFTECAHFVQNLGDGTFTHSGSLAVRFAVMSGANITYKLLYNQAIGMTGGQNVHGGMAVPALTRMLEAEGVRRIIVTTDEPERYRGVALAANASVRHRDELPEAERSLAAIAGCHRADPRPAMRLGEAPAAQARQAGDAHAHRADR